MSTKKKKEEELDYDPNVNKEELDMLNQEDIHKDGGQDEQLRERNEDVDFAATDLDIPGRDGAKQNKGKSGLKDEENDFYSQGGPDNEHENNRDPL